MRIRYYLAKKSNVEKMNKINTESMPENYPIDFWENVVSKHLSWVAKYKQDVVGYILIGPINNELCIISLAIDLQFRNNGIANGLLNTAITKILHLKKINLHVRLNNSIAINLYEKYGFKTIQREPNYYENPCEDALKLSRG